MTNTLPDPLTLSEFKASIQELPSEEAARLRRRFIDAFVDTGSEFYRTKIARLDLHVDGWCYEGYLWDCIKNPTILAPTEFHARLSARPATVYVMWDIHSRDKVRIPGYWKFDKAAVLALPASTLAQNLLYLPEDLYIFDADLRWALVTTHEEAPSGARLYLSAG